MFAHHVRDLEPDVVIDMICFTPASARALVEGLRGVVGHLIHCGSIWRHGISASMPMTEDDPSEPFGEYGVQKAAIAALLRAETEAGGLVTTSLHPGHISGPGWPVINPVGNLDPSVWQHLSAGSELVDPGSRDGAHASRPRGRRRPGVRARRRASGRGGRAGIQRHGRLGAQRARVRGYRRGVVRPRGVLRSVSWEEFRATTAEFADSSWQHLCRSQCMSIDKALAAARLRAGVRARGCGARAVSWLIEHEKIEVDAPMLAPSP